MPLTVSPGPNVRGKDELSSEAVRSGLPAEVSPSTTSGLLLVLVTANRCEAVAPSRSSPKSRVSGCTRSSLSTPRPDKTICRGEQVGQGVIRTVAL